MKRVVPVIILICLLAIAAGVVYGFVRAKNKRETALNDFYLCETHFKEGQYQKAYQGLEAFLSNHGRSEKVPEAYYYLAMSREELGNSSKAMEAWNKIVDEYPESPHRGEAYYHLGKGYHKAENLDKAMDNYKIVTNQFSDMPIAAGSWYGIGVIHENKGEDSQAVAAYRNVLDKFPDSEFAYNAEDRWGDINLKQFLNEDSTTYTVKRGDSLVRIARKYKISPNLIMRLNGMTAEMLQPGQVLKILKPDFKVAVSVSKNRLYLSSGNKLIKRYLVSTGKKETPTPLGEFRVTDKLPDPVWYSTTPSGAKEVIAAGDPRNELGTRWIGFKPAYGIHGTIYPQDLGKAVSKGCVRMHNNDVEELYDLIAEGTPVKISN